MPTIFPIVSGAVNLAAGLYGMKKRRAESREAKAEFESARQNYRNLEIYNPYENIQNPYEDLTVGQQSARFQADASNTSLSNILNAGQQSMSGSGITSLAQSLANQQNQNVRSLAASIEQQELSNQSLAAQGESMNQRLYGSGETAMMNMNRTQAAGELKLSANRLDNIRAIQQQVTNQMMRGAGQVVGGGIETAYDWLSGQGE